jgi:2-phosphosulfolactate phosphatase
VTDKTLAHGQAAYDVRFDWGPTGAAAIADGAHLAVVVDVLSFTTTVSVAAQRGVTVFPYRWRDATAEQFAADRGATLARGRSQGGVTLSPASVLAAPELERLVLPSPNGSSISFDLAGSGMTVVGACLRNRTAVARWLAPRLESGSRLAVVAAGERWPDASLRPAVEDLWGAGSVLAALLDLGVTGLSPEAEQAAAAFTAVEGALPGRLWASASGRELDAIGFGDDVRVAGEVDAGDVVPVLVGEAFRPE